MLWQIKQFLQVILNFPEQVPIKVNFTFYRSVFPEENNGSLKKIPHLVEPPEYSQLGLVVLVHSIPSSF